MGEMHREPVRDPRLGEALRGLAPPAAEPDWDRLRASVAARAELPLARRRSAVRRRAAARWAAALVPVAAAAGIALAVLPGGPGAPSGPRPPDAVAMDTGGSRAVPVDAVVEASYPAGYVDHLISGGADADALLLAALGEAEAAQL